MGSQDLYLDNFSFFCHSVMYCSEQETEQNHSPLSVTHLVKGDIKTYET